ncbi:hypothetical protein OUZ56_001267 [Daphnia magna]|uniref:Non-canonical purine NTP phosphatase/PRRC1 domain-containing protein n=1 Tax=Daphnia magna TaxID=35525 RepID=A0ABR0A298_9CRUS|nr:hypothetical protein OUZ56_001267 [Daphnia magna]
MLNQQEDGENGFELVDKPKEGNINEGPTPLPAWINPPTSLPLNLMAGPPPLVLPAGQLFPTTSTPTVANSQFFTGQSGLQSQTSLNLPILLPISPITEVGETHHNVPAATSDLEICVLESPLAAHEKNIADPLNEQPSKGSGLFGWMKEAMPGKAILAKVAEKARSSVDTMITTLDPQMKEFIYSGGDIDIAVASTKELKVSSVREAFQTVFGKATVKGYESQSVGTAAQPVGFASALQAARERIANLRSSGSVPPQQPVVSVEGFVVELFSDNWFEMNCLLLEDPVRNISVQVFSQPLMVPANAVARMRNCTTDSYPLRQSGFAVTVGQAVAEEFNVPATEWQIALTGISRRDILLLAAKTLANSYKS